MDITGYYSGRCKTCRSRLKGEIHRLVLEEKWKLLEVEKWLKEQGEPISDTALSDHFSNHVYPYLESMKEADKITKEYLEKTVKEEVTTLEDMRIHLTFLKDTLKNVLERGDFSSNPQMLRETRGLITDVIKALDKYEEMKSKYSLEEKIDIKKIYQDFIDSLEGIPIQYIELISTRLKEKGY